MSKDSPQFATKEFSEYMQKRNQAIEKQEELYTDDQPYDSKFEEQFNEDDQIAQLQKQVEERAKTEVKSEDTADKMEDMEQEVLFEQYASMIDQLTNADKDEIKYANM